MFEIAMGEVSVVDEWEVRLSGTGLSDGEITFAGLADLAEALQALATRVGRHLAGVVGPGRSPSAVERATTLKFRGIAQGSTILQAKIGEDGVLGEGLEHRSLNAMMEIFGGAARDEAPGWVTPQLGQATVSVLDALQAISTTCAFSLPRQVGPPIQFAAASVSREVWADLRVPEPDRRADVSVSGDLDLVDLRRGRLRIRDAFGNDVQLDTVANVDEAARLVGGQVTATGEAVLGARGQVVSLVDATVERLQMPSWTAPSLDGMDFSRTPLTGGVEGVDEDEVAAFLELIGR
ncbi:hypothetical protein ND486_27750 [Pseudonocardia sp. DR1-2]|uniref:hypothetical protein n=1 Tax=Pseudonocardia sp. DR1-2 TaxID=2951168 RepID=UPI002043D761|nr:hypothetical protein [Pseudonocardia sp. DR1-2]MCM3849990.1 hypothetical protein [Pseudonocardia sp. DR1-2]